MIDSIIAPPGRDACPLQGYSRLLYPFTHLGGERERQTEIVGVCYEKWVSFVLPYLNVDLSVLSLSLLDRNRSAVQRCFGHNNTDKHWLTVASPYRAFSARDTSAWF